MKTLLFKSFIVFPVLLAITYVILISIIEYFTIIFRIYATY